MVFLASEGEAGRRPGNLGVRSRERRLRYDANELRRKPQVVISCRFVS